MLARAVSQRDRHEDDAALSLDMARLALSGAENHLAAVDLPPRDAKEILQEVRKLRRKIAGFEGGAGGPPREARRSSKKRKQKVHSQPAA